MIEIKVVIDGQNITMTGGGTSTTPTERQLAKEVARAVAGRVSMYVKETIAPLTFLEKDQE